MTSPTESPWRVQMLGGFAARRGRAVVSRFRTRKMAGLLAYLASHPDQAHPREAVIERFWPDSPTCAGRQSLSQALCSLRHQLEPPGVEPGAVIIADRLTVRVDPRAITTDVAEFEHFHHAAQGALDGTMERRISLTHALDLYRGEFLPGLYDDWVLTERERLAELRHGMWIELIGLYEQAGEDGSAIETARLAVATDPLREHAQRTLMRLLAQSGQVAAALRQYREFEERLRADLELDPDPATRALARAIQDGTLSREGPGIGPPDPSHRAAVRARTIPKIAPAGTVTFLVAAGQGAADRASATARTHGGCLVRSELDAGAAVFDRALDALAAARELLRPGAGCEPNATPLAIALHTGDLADPPVGSPSKAQSACRYHGPLLDRAERLLLAAHPGQILASETTARLLDGDGLAIHDLGIFRPRSGIVPERWFEIADPGTPTRFPPPKAERALSRHLPLQLTRFIGRESELTQLAIRLRHPEHRLVALVGPGGTGKTRLALEAASRVASDVPALLFVPLADLTDPEHIPGAVLEALQRPIERSSDPISALAHALEGTEAWLILDNLEHLLPRGAAIVTELLARIPQLRLIVTSRRPLGIAGEWRFPVPPLATPEGPATPAELVALESVQLFVDRAQAVRPDFQVSESNARTLAQLCSRLDGLPLAIELAAARALVLGPAQMLRRLDRRLDFLATRRPDVPSRHRTLRATLEWSYRLLAPDVQRFFAQLAVFRGPMTLAAVEAVSEDPVALDHLIELRECSLILSQEVGNEMRFRLLDTIREFAAEKLPESARAELEHRHAEHYVALAERARLGVNSAQESTWLDRIALEHDHLRAVLDRCAAGNEDVQLGLRLTAAIASFWSFRGHFREGRQRIAELLVLPAAAERTALRAQALLESGNLALQESATAEGIPALEESLAIFRELGDEAGIGRAVNHLAISAYYRGDYAAASRLYQEGLDICHRIGDRRAVSQALTNLGNVANAIGDYSVARARYAESLAIKRELGIPRDIATALMGLGNVAENEGDLAASLAYHVECLSLCRQSGDRQRTAWTLVNLGNVTFKLGDTGRARGYYVESLAIAADLGDRFNLSGCLDGLSTFAFAAGEPVGAARLFSAAMTFRHAARGGVPPREQEDHESFLGELRSALGEPALAHALAEGAALAGGELSPEVIAGLLASAGIS